MIFLPFALAAAVALISRIPGSGFLVAVAAWLPYLIWGHFSFSDDWPVVFAVGVFLITDLVVLLTQRSAVVGVLTGLLAGIGVAAWPTVDFQRAGVLSDVLKESALVVEVMVLPVVMVFLAGLIGGLIGGARRA